MSINRNVSRRNFVRTTAGAAAALSAAPLVIGADKAKTGNPVLGVDGFRYECIHNWGKLPDDATYGGATHGTAIDEAGLIYITHYGSPGSIVVFDADGKFVRSLGETHMIKNKQGKMSAEGHGIDIRKEGGEEFLYLSPSNGGLPFSKMNMKGEIVWNRGKADIGKDFEHYAGRARYRPTNQSFRPDGGYYLGDGYGSGFLMHYDKDDKFVRAIGGGGTEDGKFRTPHGQWLDDRDGTPKLVVADRANKRLQWFDMDGQFIKKLDGFLFPADIDVKGDVMLVPDLHARITLLDKDNKVITHIGGQDEADETFEAWKGRALKGMRGRPNEWKAGRFVHPHDACFDHDDNIFIAEWVVGGRVTKLRKVD